jgi:6-methylsalicylate decarboxylase
MSEFLSLPKVDTHCHHVTKSFVGAVNKYFGGNPDNFPMPDWSVDEHLGFMDRLNIVHSVLSYSSPHINFATPEINRELTRAGNEEGAAAVKKHPSKFSLLASLPLPDIESTLAEIAYACDVLKVDGFTLPSNAKGLYMGDPRLEPVYAELNRRKAVVTFHPNKPSSVPLGVAEKLPIPIMEFLFDTTRTVVDLIVKGYVTKYSDIKFLIPHGGSMVPGIVERLRVFKPVLLKIGCVSEDFDLSDITSRLYFDLAGSPGHNLIRHVLELTDESHLFYASDYPFTTEDICLLLGENIFNSPDLSASQRIKFAHKNAAALFPRVVV